MGIDYMKVVYCMFESGKKKKRREKWRQRWG